MPSFSESNSTTYFLLLELAVHSFQLYAIVDLSEIITTERRLLIIIQAYRYDGVFGVFHGTIPFIQNIRELHIQRIDEQGNNTDTSQIINLSEYLQNYNYENGI